jgi:hypothetical protein
VSEERITRCRSCEAPVIWVRMTETDGKPGKAMPVNAEPNGRVLIRFGPNGENAKMAQAWTSHFATCPSAEQWRKP